MHVDYITAPTGHNRAILLARKGNETREAVISAETLSNKRQLALLAKSLFDSAADDNEGDEYSRPRPPAKHTKPQRFRLTVYKNGSRHAVQRIADTADDAFLDLWERYGHLYANAPGDDDKALMCFEICKGLMAGRYKPQDRVYYVYNVCSLLNIHMKLETF